MTRFNEGPAARPRLQLHKDGKGYLSGCTGQRPCAIGSWTVQKEPWPPPLLEARSVASRGQGGPDNKPHMTQRTAQPLRGVGQGTWTVQASLSRRCSSDAGRARPSRPAFVRAAGRCPRVVKNRRTKNKGRKTGRKGQATAPAVAAWAASPSPEQSSATSRGPPLDRDRRDCPLTCAPTSAPRAPAGASAPPSAGKGLPARAAGAAGLPEPRARCPGRAAVCASARAGRSLGGRPPNALVKRASPALQPAGAAGSGTWPRRRGRPGVESRGPSGLTQLRGDPAAALGLAC